MKKYITNFKHGASLHLKFEGLNLSVVIIFNTFHWLIHDESYSVVRVALPLCRCCFASEKWFYVVVSRPLKLGAVCSDEGLTLETSAKHHIPQATNIPYQPLLIKPIFSVLAHAEKQFFSKLVFEFFVIIAELT